MSDFKFTTGMTDQKLFHICDISSSSLSFVVWFPRLCRLFPHFCRFSTQDPEIFRLGIRRAEKAITNAVGPKVKHTTISRLRFSPRPGDDLLRHNVRGGESNSSEGSSPASSCYQVHIFLPFPCQIIMWCMNKAHVTLCQWLARKSHVKDMYLTRKRNNLSCLVLFRRRKSSWCQLRRARRGCLYL